MSAAMHGSASLLIFVVEDDPDLRRALEAILKPLGVVKTFEFGRAFLDAVETDDVGCVVLDLRLPDVNGLEVLAELQARDTNLAAVVLTGHGDVATAVTAMKAGAVDFLEKPTDAQQLRDVVAAALASSADCAERRTRQRLAAERVLRLDPRQQNVLALSAEGLPVKTIARRLGVSIRTAERLRGEVLNTLGTNTFIEASDVWRESGLESAVPPTF